MARKSRKHIENPNVPARPLALRTAAYLRISETKLELPPESIENQLKIIEAFLDRRPDLTLVATYKDVNVSGRTFQREGFQHMIEAIDLGKIDCVIVKDLSRLGRNFVETGYYIEKYFPLHDIGLISVTDQVETVDGISNLDKRNPTSPRTVAGQSIVMEPIFVNQMSCLLSGRSFRPCSRSVLRP